MTCCRDSRSLAPPAAVPSAHNSSILILIMPRLLNFIIAIYLILIGLMGLNGIYHFIRL
jgi:DUF3096 family protein